MSAPAWDAPSYHIVSNPHVVWGAPVLARLPLCGDETVIDAGCGTGRLTELLVERLPRGKVIALDRDPGMIDKARQHLARFGDRVEYVVSSVLELADRGLVADAVFSTATFHWVKDHDALFANLFRVLRPGGLLVAQCGGGPNLARLLARLGPILAEPKLAPYFPDAWVPWFYAGPDDTRERLERAGFVDIETSLTDAPTPFASRAEFRAFVAGVILGQRLAPLADSAHSALRDEILERLVDAASNDDPPFVLDYVRLNLHGARPR